MAAVLVLLAAGVSLGLFFALRSDESAPVARPTPAPTPASTLETTPTAAPGVVTTATPAPSGVRLRLFVWADGRGQWQSVDLQAEGSDYVEGEAIAFMLRIDEANPGTVYRVTLGYDCQANDAAGFDFLAGFDRNAGSAPALAEPGPGRLPPDAAIPIPDDPSLAFDDEANAGPRFFHLWGATFAAEPIGPGPDTPCGTDSQVLLDIRAQEQTAFLLWGGHLGRSTDWGANRGASSQGRPFGMEVKMGAGSAELRIVPGAIGP